MSEWGLMTLGDSSIGRRSCAGPLARSGRSAPAMLCNDKLDGDGDVNGGLAAAIGYQLPYQCHSSCSNAALT